MREKTLWEQTVEFHGHECMGVAMGHRVGEAAMGVLETKDDSNIEMMAIVENATCPVDGIQVITGCTIGKRNLIIKDFGNQVYNFSFGDNTAIRIIPKEVGGEKRKEVIKLREKVKNKEATQEEKDLYRSEAKVLIDEILSKPLEEVCSIEEIEYVKPEALDIFTSSTCYCEEK